MKEKFSITGMTCSACALGIEKAVKKLDGVEKAEVSLMGEWLIVEYSEETLSKKDIFSAVLSLGYGIQEYDERAFKKEEPQPKKLKKRFFISLALLIPLMYFSMGGMISLPQPSEKISSIIQAVLSAVIIGVNFKFYTSGTRALFKGVPNMDTLVSLGSFASYVYSLIGTIFLFLGESMGHLFYESAAMILTLVTLGKWLEERSKKRTGEEIEKLIKLIPNAVLVERDGQEQVIPFAEIQVGDTVIVKNGDYVPVDGVVMEGSAFIDRAAITGESMPVEVSLGGLVTGADIVKSGYLKIRAEKVGEDTALSQIVKMVKEAGASKAPLQKTADKIAGIFVPAVTLLAILTFIIWFVTTEEIKTAINYAISVLVISCPCSLGLATPVAVMAATGKGMSLGILYKDAEALQKAKDVTCVLLDKTATLTEGKAKVTDFETFGIEEKDALFIALTLESKSNHPIADCVRAFADGKDVQAGEVDGYEYITGKGAVGKVNGKVYYLGNKGILPVKAKAKEKELRTRYLSSGKTLVYLADEENLIALFAVADSLKETSKEAVKTLQEKGIAVGMLTGDSEEVAKAIASEVGIRDYYAEALPENKAESVKRVRAMGGVIAMVGDGINDSPALKAADLGVAMGTGTDIAIESADVVLAGGDLKSLPVMVD
ncbi:MAG: cadmium-translocating P-type ATPase, partial [Clostridia bacterium]|nr:cadmium-translocating P-type ATPase [Clostridia bacterium]